MIETFHIAPGCCPRCSTRIDVASSIEDSEPPSKGDITICLNCLQLLQFEDNLSLRLFTDEEFVELSAEERSNINEILTVLKSIKKDT